MDAFHPGRAADAVYDVFQTAAGKAVMGSLTADKKGGVIVSAGFEIIFQMDVGAGIEVCHALFVPFAEYGYIVLRERDV